MKYLFSALIALLSLQTVVAQEPGPVQKKITDSICNCLNKLDMSNVKTSDQAQSAFLDCFSQHAMGLLSDLADERKVEMSDDAQMQKIGYDIGKDLLKQKCDGFIKISVLMSKDKLSSKIDEEVGLSSTSGKLKRIDTKDFSYIIIQDKDNKEKSFIWLRQFPDSEKFMNDVARMIGKPIKIAWREIEVYLPKAKGYYKLKEIVGIEN